MYMNPYDAYKKQDLETSNRQELVGKLYNEGSVSLKKAILAVNEKRLESANEYIKKAEVIVSTLNKSLDMNYDISSHLRSLYNYMYKRMMQANLKKDSEILEEISGIFSELRDAWNEAIIRSRKLQST